MQEAWGVFWVDQLQRLHCPKYQPHELQYEVSYRWGGWAWAQELTGVGVWCVEGGGLVGRANIFQSICAWSCQFREEGQECPAEYPEVQGQEHHWETSWW